MVFGTPRLVKSHGERLFDPGAVVKVGSPFLGVEAPCSLIAPAPDSEGGGFVISSALGLGEKILALAFVVPLAFGVSWFFYSGAGFDGVFSTFIIASTVALFALLTTLLGRKRIRVDCQNAKLYLEYAGGHREASLVVHRLSVIANRHAVNSTFSGYVIVLHASDCSVPVLAVETMGAALKCVNIEFEGVPISQGAAIATQNGFIGIAVGICRSASILLRIA